VWSRGRNAARQPSGYWVRLTSYAWCSMPVTTAPSPFHESSQERSAGSGCTLSCRRAASSVTRSRRARRSSWMGLTTSSATSRGPEGKSDEAFQFVEIERLVQKADDSCAQGVAFLLSVQVPAHHEDRRVHTKIANARQQVEPLSPKQGVTYSWQNHVYENEIKVFPLNDDERIGDRLSRRDLTRVPVPERADDLPQHLEHARLIIDDKDALFQDYSCHADTCRHAVQTTFGLNSSFVSTT
jgi:hypothetical protein